MPAPRVGGDGTDHDKADIDEDTRTGTEGVPRLFYGWVIVATVFVMLVVTAGLGFYNASVILKAAVDEFDASVSAVSGGTALFFGASGVTGFALARQMDRFDLRWFYASGGVIGAIALASLRFVDSVPKLYVFFTVFGVAFSTAGLLPSVTLIARWFDTRRSVALSVGSTGLSVGGIAITPFAARFIESRTLAGAGPWLGLVWLVGVVPLSLLLLRSHPSDKGLEPDGAPHPPVPVDASGPVGLPGATFAEAVGTRFFKLLSATYALVFLAQVGALAQLFNLVSERIDESAAALTLSTLAFSSVVGRLAGGVIVTRISTRHLTAVLILVQAAALALVALAESRTSMLLAAALFGASVGNLLMLQPLLVAETFGVGAFSRIYSFNQLFGTIGVAGGPFLLGALRDLVDYRFSFGVAAATNVVGFVLLVLAGPTAAAASAWARPDLARPDLDHPDLAAAPGPSEPVPG